MPKVKREDQFEKLDTNIGESKLIMLGGLWYRGDR